MAFDGKSISKIVVMVIVFIATLFIPIVFKGKFEEHFINYGSYPHEQEFPLLYPEYKLKPEYKKTSNVNYQDIYNDYPTYESNSTEINNKKYWKTPDNGMCSPAEMCNALYADSETPGINEIGIVDPNPAWDNKRINFYQASDREGIPYIEQPDEFDQ